MPPREKSKRLSRRPAHLPPARRETVRFHGIGAAGEGVAEVGGRRIFVSLAAPGDLAQVDIRGDRGTIHELLERSACRIDPPCGIFGRCGGCALQHVDPQFYAAWKREQVANALSRVGLGDAPVADLVLTPAPSRRRASFAVRRTKNGKVFGFNARRSTDVVALDQCLILHPEIEKRLAALAAFASRVPSSAFDLNITLCLNGLDATVVGADAKEPTGAALLDLIEAASISNVIRLSIGDVPVFAIESPIVEFAGIPVWPPPGAFLQASKEGEDALVRLVVGAAAGRARVADLFSGCGTFALPLARGARVTAVDSDAASIDALDRAARNAQRLGISLQPINVVRRDLFERPLSSDELKGFDVVVFDPPRAGAGAQAVEIVQSKVPLVVGVSCNPATFARDAAILSRGGFNLTQVTPVDQFVYAPHVELVGIFRR